jgi:hypothetical protein
MREKVWKKTKSSQRTSNAEQEIRWPQNDEDEDDDLLTFPALSRPKMRIRTSLDPKRLSNILLNMIPMVCVAAFRWSHLFVSVASEQLECFTS